MKDLTRGDETRLLIAFALPMLAGNVFQQFYNMVDSWVVGRFVGTDALAAVGASFPVIFLMLALVMGVSMGANVLIAQYFGAGDLDRVRRAVDTTYLVMAWAGLAFTAFGLLAAEPLLRLLRVPAAVLGPAVQYLRIIFAGLILTFGYNGVGAILRGLGDSNTPLAMLVAATVANVALDLLFVAGLGWGVAGAAWATVISQGLSFIGCLIYLNRRHALLRTDFLHLRFDAEIFRTSLRIGLPSGLQQTLVSLGMMVMSGLVNGFGAVAMAGFAAASRIDSFIGMPAMNLGMALSSFTGQNLGAGRPDRARRGLRVSLGIGMGLTAVLAAGLWLFAEPLVAIFTADAAVIAVGRGYLRVIAPFYFAFNAMFIINGLIRGAGETVVPLLSTLVAMWVVRVPAGLLFSRLWGLDGVWWAWPTGWFVGLAVAALYYRSGRWERHALVRRQGARPGPPPLD